MGVVQNTRNFNNWIPLTVLKSCFSCLDLQKINLIGVCRLGYADEVWAGFRKAQVRLVFSKKPFHRSTAEERH